MSHSLSRWQTIGLGLVVILALGAGGFGIARIADKQGIWAESIEVEAGFPEANDVSLGTPVRIRGVEAGQVIAIDYPSEDAPGAEVALRLKLQARFAARIYADATVQIQGSGVFGSKVIAINPGTPGSGQMTGNRLKGLKPFNLDEAVSEFRDVGKEAKETATEIKKLAIEAKGLVKEVRGSNGTIPKLLRDDDLYRDIKEIAADARGLVKRTDAAVGRVDGEMDGLRGFVSDGRDTLRSLRQGTDAISKMPVIRGYVEDAAALLVRPAHKRDRMTYNSVDIFNPGTAMIAAGGQEHLNAVANWLRNVKNDKADLVVCAMCDPADKTQTAASASELTRKQAEAAIEYLKGQGVYKLGWVTRRKMTPLGMGMTPSPVIEKEKLPASNVQFLLYTPQ